jgi:hypothetical protein
MERHANEFLADQLIQISYLNSVVMPDEDSSDSSEADSDEANEDNDTAADENDWSPKLDTPDPQSYRQDTALWRGYCRSALLIRSQRAIDG